MKINLSNLISQEILIEKRSKDVIIVDIQPMYQNYFGFDLEVFGQFLLSNRRILFFYNGPDTVGDDTKEDIIEMFYNATYSEELIDKLQNDTIWIDKGYAFFRGWMDNGADEGFIQRAIRHMVNSGVNDSRDIEAEEWSKLFPDDWDDSFEYDPIFMPDISVGDLKTWNGSYLTGGGKNECLREVQLLMNAFNIKYTLVGDFIY